MKLLLEQKFEDDKAQAELYKNVVAMGVSVANGGKNVPLFKEEGEKNTVGDNWKNQYTPNAFKSKEQKKSLLEELKTELS